MDDPKPYHTLILDAGPIIKNTPPVSTLLLKSYTLVTVPAIINEIRDAATRGRLETTLRPFLTLRDPIPASVAVVQEFARRSGDLAVLSDVDIKLLALAYELECERNGGDWRLRKVPGQKGLNGSPPKRAEEEEKMEEQQEEHEERENNDPDNAQNANAGDGVVFDEHSKQQVTDEPSPQQEPVLPEESSTVEPEAEEHAKTTTEESLDDTLARTHISDQLEDPTPTTLPEQVPSLSNSPGTEPDEEPPSASDSDSDGWITPSNLRKHQAADSDPASSTTTAVSSAKKAPTTLQVATLTTDFAMQNVLLLMNLNLLSPTLMRVSRLKTHILRCHSCFLQVKDLAKQFCPRCGKPTLTRVTCSTDARTGEFRVHLKQNMQWNTRGDRFSIPKPTHGSASGRRDTGGGKGGWGRELILAEDQKEYVRRVEEGKRSKVRDLMDEDFLPAILSGERNRQGGRPKVGAGRNVNSRRR